LFECIALSWAGHQFVEKQSGKLTWCGTGLGYGGQAIVSGQAWTPGPVQLQTLNVCTGLSDNRSGPLMGGAMSTKELYKWIDDCISSCLPQDSLRLLWGLLKVACQHYGKLRSLMVSSGISSKVTTID
jgi:hypothetical protein